MWIFKTHLMIVIVVEMFDFGLKVSGRDLSCWLCITYYPQHVMLEEFVLDSQISF